jgi:hypothetical protein
LVTVTVGPAIPPVVPFCPRAFTLAKPIGLFSASGAAASARVGVDGLAAMVPAATTDTSPAASA